MIWWDFGASWSEAFIEARKMATTYHLPAKWRKPFFSPLFYFDANKEKSFPLSRDRVAQKELPISDN